ncbi:MAG: LysR family substrate-binding domain-containing protein [Klebsiella pneumoniae]
MRAAVGDGPGDHHWPASPRSAWQRWRASPSSRFARRHGLYDDILGLLRRYGHTPKIAQEVGEAMTIIGLVAAGLGVSILPASFQRVQLSEMRWLPIDEQDAVSEMWLVWSKHHEQGALAKRFREALLSWKSEHN